MKYLEVLEIVKREFRLDIFGDHGVYHWFNVYKNTQILARHYGVNSDVFELFSYLHDSKRISEFYDKDHGKRGAEFAKELISQGVIKLDKKDKKRLIFACENHTKANPKNSPINDLIIKICIDSDRLDLLRVGIIPKKEYLFTDYAKKICESFFEM
jgi:uncharacterized protein